MKFVCDECRFLQRTIIDVYKRQLNYDVKKYKHLSLWCEYHCNNIQKIKKECEHFKLRSGKIGKKHYQKNLSEI